MSYQPSVYRKQGGAELVIASSGVLTVETGGYLKVPVQSLGTSQTATAVTNYGISKLTGSTTGPVFTMAAPSAAGLVKYLVLNPTSTGATHRCVVYAGSTGCSVNSTGANQITLTTSAKTATTLVSLTTASWREVGHAGAYAGYSNKST